MFDRECRFVLGFGFLGRVLEVVVVPVLVTLEIDDRSGWVSCFDAIVLLIWGVVTFAHWGGGFRVVQV